MVCKIPAAKGQWDLPGGGHETYTLTATRAVVRWWPWDLSVHEGCGPPPIKVAQLNGSPVPADQCLGGSDPHSCS